MKVCSLLECVGFVGGYGVQWEGLHAKKFSLEKNGYYIAVF